MAVFFDPESSISLQEKERVKKEPPTLKKKSGSGAKTQIQKLEEAKKFAEDLKNWKSQTRRYGFVVNTDGSATKGVRDLLSKTQQEVISKIQAIDKSNKAFQLDQFIAATDRIIAIVDGTSNDVSKFEQDKKVFEDTSKKLGLSASLLSQLNLALERIRQLIAFNTNTFDDDDEHILGVIEEAIALARGNLYNYAFEKVSFPSMKKEFLEKNANTPLVITKGLIDDIYKNLNQRHEVAIVDFIQSMSDSLYQLQSQLQVEGKYSKDVSKRLEGVALSKKELEKLTRFEPGELEEKLSQFRNAIQKGIDTLYSEIGKTAGNEMQKKLGQNAARAAADAFRLSGIEEDTKIAAEISRIIKQTWLTSKNSITEGKVFQSDRTGSRKPKDKDVQDKYTAAFRSMTDTTTDRGVAEFAKNFWNALADLYIWAKPREGAPYIQQFDVVEKLKSAPGTLSERNYPRSIYVGGIIEQYIASIAYKLLPGAIETTDLAITEMQKLLQGIGKGDKIITAKNEIDAGTETPNLPAQLKGTKDWDIKIFESGQSARSNTDPISVPTTKRTRADDVLPLAAGRKKDDQLQAKKEKIELSERSPDALGSLLAFANEIGKANKKTELNVFEDQLKQGTAISVLELIPFDKQLLLDAISERKKQIDANPSQLKKDKNVVTLVLQKRIGNAKDKSSLDDLEKVVKSLVDAITFDDTDVLESLIQERRELLPKPRQQSGKRKNDFVSEFEKKIKEATTKQELTNILGQIEAALKRTTSPITTADGIRLQNLVEDKVKELDSTLEQGRVAGPSTPSSSERISNLKRVIDQTISLTELSGIEISIKQSIKKAKDGKSDSFSKGDVPKLNALLFSIDKKRKELTTGPESPDITQQPFQKSSVPTASAPALRQLDPTFITAEDRKNMLEIAFAVGRNYALDMQPPYKTERKGGNSGNNVWVRPDWKDLFNKWWERGDGVTGIKTELETELKDVLLSGNVFKFLDGKIAESTRSKEDLVIGDIYKIFDDLARWDLPVGNKEQENRVDTFKKQQDETWYLTRSQTKLSSIMYVLFSENRFVDSYNALVANDRKFGKKVPTSKKDESDLELAVGNGQFGAHPTRVLVDIKRFDNIKRPEDTGPKHPWVRARLKSEVGGELFPSVYDRVDEIEKLHSTVMVLYVKMERQRLFEKDGGKSRKEDFVRLSTLAEGIRKILQNGTLPSGSLLNLFQVDDYSEFVTGRSKHVEQLEKSIDQYRQGVKVLLSKYGQRPGEEIVAMKDIIRVSNMDQTTKTLRSDPGEPLSDKGKKEALASLTELFAFEVPPAEALKTDDNSNVGGQAGGFVLENTQKNSSKLYLIYKDILEGFVVRHTGVVTRTAVFQTEKVQAGPYIRVLDSNSVVSAVFATEQEKIDNFNRIPSFGVPISSSTIAFALNKSIAQTEKDIYEGTSSTMKPTNSPGSYMLIFDKQISSGSAPASNSAGIPASYEDTTKSLGQEALPWIRERNNTSQKTVVRGKVFFQRDKKKDIFEDPFTSRLVHQQLYTYPLYRLMFNEESTPKEFPFEYVREQQDDDFDELAESFYGKEVPASAEKPVDKEVAEVLDELQDSTWTSWD
jgi:hypothetical protein